MSEFVNPLGVTAHWDENSPERKRRARTPRDETPTRLYAVRKGAWGPNISSALTLEQAERILASIKTPDHGYGIFEDEASNAYLQGSAS